MSNASPESSDMVETVSQPQTTNEASSPASNDVSEQLKAFADLITEQQIRLAALTNEVARLQTLYAPDDALDAQGSQTQDEENTPAEGAEEINDARPTSAPSRRTLLKWGGVGAAVAALAAAGSGALGHEVAHAGAGSNFILGQGNYAENTTTLYLDSGSDTQILSIEGSTSLNNAGLVTNVSEPNSYGVYAITDEGYGVVGNASAIGIDFYSSGSGRIRQLLRETAGTPTGTYTFNAGEQVRDSNGDLYICVASGYIL